MKLSPLVQANLEECTRVRRDLHRIPEIAFHEHQTQAYIMQYLTPLQPDVLQPIAGTGVKAVFYAKNPTDTIGFRADIDALPIEEWTELPFASTHPGCMHACGHDGHTTVALVLCKLVHENRDKLKNNIVVLFQPAEEGGSGAERMIEGGALENPQIDRLYGLHVWPELKKGRLGIRRGVFMAQSCGFDLTVRGKSAHGAKPDMGIDAVVAAAELISMLQTVVSRSTNPDEPVVLTIGKIQGGEARNIICDKVVLNGTLRVLTDTMHDYIFTRISEILKGFELATGITTELSEVQHYYGVENPPEMCREFERLVKADIESMQHLMIGEDFSSYQRHVPGMFFFVGVGEHTGFPPLHNAHFNFDESALLYGLEAYCRVLGFTQ
ncbi:MAG: M20 family metallopeptidase [Eubacteriales bacterium]|nr:M20 family metallopeptidase [Eubacteriales bacterium]